MLEPDCTNDRDRFYVSAVDPNTYNRVYSGKKL